MLAERWMRWLTAFKPKNKNRIVRASNRDRQVEVTERRIQPKLPSKINRRHLCDLFRQALLAPSRPAAADKTALSFALPPPHPFHALVRQPACLEPFEGPPLGYSLGSALSGHQPPTTDQYWLAELPQRYAGSLTARCFDHALPLGTLAVNLIGCLLIGSLAALFLRYDLPHEQYRLALTVGVLGGFTTFSAFGLDTFALLERGHWWLALLNVS
jgi:protein CrcB